jgi:hypothetical protein
MKSAKFTAVTFLAGSVLGAIALTGGGCTVTSGTVDDTDGGSSGSSGDAGKDSGGDSSDSATPDAARTCSVPEQQGIIGSAACQACLDTNCCAEQQGCFAIKADPGGTTVDCNAYVDCINVCNQKPTDQEKVDCYKDTCDATAAEGVSAAYDKIDTCQTSKCSAECAK